MEKGIGLRKGSADLKILMSFAEKMLRKSLAGRVGVLRMAPMSQREIMGGRKHTFFPELSAAVRGNQKDQTHDHAPDFSASMERIHAAGRG